MLGSHIVDLIKENILINSSDSPIDSLPKRSIPCMSMKLMVEGEKSGITNETMVEAR